VARTSEGGFFRRRQLSRRRLIAQGGAATAAGLGIVAVGADPAQAAAAVMYTGSSNQADAPTELFAPLPGDSALHVDNNTVDGVAIEATSQGIGISATGKKVPLLLNPGTTAGPPPGDNHVRGEVYVDVFGRIWHCIAPSSPTWVRPGFNAINPLRIVDTRAGYGTPYSTGNKVGQGQSLLVTVIGSPAVPVPVGATAVAGTVTMHSGTLSSWGIVYPDGIAVPNVANLNYVPGPPLNAFVVAKIGDNGKIRLFNKYGSVHFIFDLAGFYF
jgi:hypothetical protein